MTHHPEPQGPALVREKLESIRDLTAPPDDTVDAALIYRLAREALSTLDAQPEAVRDARIQNGQPEAGPDVETVATNVAATHALDLLMDLPEHGDDGTLRNLQVRFKTAILAALARLQPQEREK